MICPPDKCEWPHSCDGRRCINAGGAIRSTADEMREAEKANDDLDNVVIKRMALISRVPLPPPETPPMLPEWKPDPLPRPSRWRAILGAAASFAAIFVLGFVVGLGAGGVALRAGLACIGVTP